MTRHLRLQHRIVIPFATVAIVTMSVAALLARSFFSNTLEARVVAQVQNTVRVLGQSDFALNSQILRSARQIAAADIITYKATGEILATTVDAVTQPGLTEQVATQAAAHDVLAESRDSILIRRIPGDSPLVVAYRRLPGSADTLIAVIADTSELASATRAITRTILVATSLCLLVMILVSQIVARRVTAPLDALVSFARDVTPEGSRQRAGAGDDEVGRLASAFNEMLDRLDRSRAQQVRSEKLALAGLMAARVAHDIRNPLASMKMQAQLLAADLRSRAGSAAGVDAILRDIQQLESVVRDLIELARPGELRREPASVTSLVNDVLEQLSAQLSYRKIAVRCQMAEGLPRVSLDAARFRQALLNVIGNAADAMPTGGNLCVRTQLDADWLVLDIIDDGSGIDPAVRDQLFDPFVSTKRDGVGLGLVNAKAVVEQHGGRIELGPAEGQGTRARITLPITSTEEARS